MSDNKRIFPERSVQTSPQTSPQTNEQTSPQTSLQTNEQTSLQTNRIEQLEERVSTLISNDIESNLINTKVIDINHTKIKKFNFRDECRSYIMCGSVLLALGIIGCTITYIVYMIMSLCQTSYNEQKVICNKSNTWLYLLLSLIINAIVGSSVTRSESQDQTKPKSIINCKIIIELFSGLTFLIWGCIELFGIGCVEDLKSTLLYTMLQVTVITNIVVGCLTLIIGLVTCGLFCCAAFNR
jgi:hypothetical protein